MVISLARSREDTLATALTASKPNLLKIALTKATPELLATALEVIIQGALKETVSKISFYGLFWTILHTFEHFGWHFVSLI